MRRVLASISNQANVGDVTTLSNPEIVKKVRKMVQGEEDDVFYGQAYFSVSKIRFRRCIKR